MATRAIKPKRDDSLLTDWKSEPEKAPSVVLESRPTLTRFLAVIGLLGTFIGVFAQFFPRYNVSPSWGLVLLTVGLSFLLLHAFSEKEEQYRKVYSFAGLFLLGASAILRFIPGQAGTFFLPIGVPGLALGLLVVAATLRHETAEKWRHFLSVALLGFTGAILAGGMLFVSLYRSNFVSEGVLLMIVGLLFAMVTISRLPEKLAYPAGVCLTLLGVFCIGESLVGCWTAPTADAFLVPSGFTLIVMGLIYLGVGLGIISDWPLVILTRRELAALFYSPVGYAVLFAMVALAFINFFFFAAELQLFLFQAVRQGRSPDLPEPIFYYYLINIVPVFGQMFIIPLLTMRLMSEEWRSGTLEVLLTAPVKDASVVLSKFLGVWIFYLLMWMPYFIYLVSLRVVGEKEFDYRPILSFGLAMAVTGAAFVAMGLFFSSLSRNQIIAAVFTFMAMMVYFGVHLLVRFFAERMPVLSAALTSISAVDLWFSSVRGEVIPRYLVVHAGIAVFFLFLSVKVLESRKWK